MIPMCLVSIFYRWNQFKVIPLVCTFRTRNLTKFSATSVAGWRNLRLSKWAWPDDLITPRQLRQ